MSESKKNMRGAGKEASSGKEVKSQAELLTETCLEVRRVTKVVKGGRRLTFSAFVVVGDRAGKVGVASGKSREASAAISKALKRAKKDMIEVPFYKTTIPYTVKGRHGASEVIICSAAKGTGLIAGGAMRALLEALGVQDVLAKAFGASNRANVAKATLIALGKLSRASEIARKRGKNLSDLFGSQTHVAA